MKTLVLRKMFRYSAYSENLVRIVQTSRTWFRAAIGYLVVSGLFQSCSFQQPGQYSPGIIRVNLCADSTDTAISIAGVEYSEDSSSVLLVNLSQGMVFSDSNFAPLYSGPNTYVSVDTTINLLARKGNSPQTFTIANCYLPAAKYDSIRFAFQPSLLSIGDISVPVQIQPDGNPLVRASGQFEVKEGMVTELTLKIAPLRSLKRYRDEYYMIPEIYIVSIRYYRDNL